MLGFMLCFSGILIFSKFVYLENIVNSLLALASVGSRELFTEVIFSLQLYHCLSHLQSSHSPTHPLILIQVLINLLLGEESFTRLSNAHVNNLSKVEVVHLY